jgi:hypothetical protein
VRRNLDCVNEPAPPPLRMLLYGAAGTGKSEVLRCFQSYVDQVMDDRRAAAVGSIDGGLLSRTSADLVIVLAPTGAAAVPIGGQTVHAFASIPVDTTKEAREQTEKTFADTPLTGQKARALERKLEKGDWLFTDEVGMIDAGLFGQFDIRVTKAAAKSGGASPGNFGDNNFVGFGHFAQLPPARGVALYNSDDGSAEGLSALEGAGMRAYRAIDTVVILREQMRQRAPPIDEAAASALRAAGDEESIAQLRSLVKERRETNERLQRYRSFLDRLMDSQSTPADYNWLAEHNRSQLLKFEQREPPFAGPAADVTHLSPSNAGQLKINYEAVQKTGNPVVLCVASHTGGGSPSHSREEASTEAVLPLSVGAKVMLLKNLDVTGGIANGSQGTVVKIIYPDGEGPETCLRPLCVLVRFRSYRRGGCADSLMSHVVRVTEYTCKPYQKPAHVYCTRTNIPLMLAFAKTIHKSQGSSEKLLKVNVGVKEAPHSGRTYTALSRVTDPAGLVCLDHEGESPTLERLRWAGSPGSTMSVALEARVAHEKSLEGKAHALLRARAQASQQRMAAAKEASYNYHEMLQMHLEDPDGSDRWVLELRSERWSAALLHEFEFCVLPTGWGDEEEEEKYGGRASRLSGSIVLVQRMFRAKKHCWEKRVQHSAVFFWRTPRHWMKEHAQLAQEISKEAKTNAEAATKNASDLEVLWEKQSANQQKGNEEKEAARKKQAQDEKSLAVLRGGCLSGADAKRAAFDLRFPGGKNNDDDDDDDDAGDHCNATGNVLDVGGMMGEIFDANMAYICNDCGLHPFPGTDQARDASSNSDWSLPEGLTFKFYLYDFYKNKRISANKELLKQWLQLHGVVVEFVDSETGGRSYRRKIQRGVECGVIAAKVLTMLIQNRDLLKQPTIVRDGALSNATLRESNTHLVNKGSLSASYTNSLDTCFLCESQVKLLAFMHMGVEPTQDKPLQGRWPFKCTTFDEMVRDLADIMVDAAENLQSSITFFCCNTESHSSEAGRAGGLHWMSAVFEVIALGIAGRDGQQAAGSRRRHREVRARKRQKGNTERPVDCDLASEEETKGSEVDSEEMDFDSD